LRLKTSRTSYLAAIDRVDFNGKATLTVGRASDNDLRLFAPDIEPHHLRVTVDGDQFKIDCIDPNARFKIKEEVKREAMVDPSYIQ
jgi:pSer/pThr/pTyr-binding forkhead associated (FHA) protein